MLCLRYCSFFIYDHFSTCSTFCLCWKCMFFLSQLPLTRRASSIDVLIIFQRHRYYSFIIWAEMTNWRIELSWRYLIFRSIYLALKLPEQVKDTFPSASIFHEEKRGEKWWQTCTRLLRMEFFKAYHAGKIIQFKNPTFI